MKKRIGLGTFGVRSAKELKEIIKQAVIHHYDFVDTALVYNNEKAIGTAFKMLKKEGFDANIKIQTKIWPDDYNDVKGAIGRAMEKLNVDKLDMCLLHRRHYDLNMDISAWKQLIKCHKKGMVDEIGVSNYDRDELEIMKYKTKMYPTSNQIELSVNNMRWDRIAYLQSKGIEVQSWSPMGNLAANLKNEILINMAQKYQTDVPSILIAFLSSLGFSVVVKTAHAERVGPNKKAFLMTLAEKDLEVLKTINAYDIKYSQTYCYDIHLNDDTN